MAATTHANLSLGPGTPQFFVPKVDLDEFSWQVRGRIFKKNQELTPDLQDLRARNPK